MGQTNKKTVTKVNNGELAEFVAALSAISCATGLSLPEVHRAMRISKDGRNTMRVHGEAAGIRYSGDGKMALPYKEMEQFFLGNTTENVQEVVDSCERFVRSLALPPFDEVRNQGGSNRKDDLVLLEESAVVDLWSIKWKHDYAEKSQSPNWDTSVAPFYGKFVKVDEMKPVYTSRAETFLTSALRNSGGRGDWSPELRLRGLALLDAVMLVEGYVAARFVNGPNSSDGIDPLLVATGYIESFIGEADNVLWAQIDSGHTVRYRRSDIASLARVIARSQFTARQESTGTGLTRDTWIRMNDCPFIHFRTTASTNPADKANKDLREVKRQTYLDLSPVPAWPICGCQAGLQVGSYGHSPSLWDAH